MAGKYTEAQKRASMKYFNRLKIEGRPHSHGTNEQKRRWAYVNETVKMIKYLFRE